MKPTTRTRVLVPLLMPLTILGGILLFSGSLAQVLLAVDKNVSVLVAVVAAAYVMGAAFLVERNRQVSGRALGLVMVIGLAGVVGAGAVSASVGIREIHHEEEKGHGGEGEGGEGEGGEVAIPADAMVWGADNGLAYTSAPTSGPAGTVTLALEHSGSLEHNVVFEGVQNDAPLVASTGGVDVAEVTIEPGTYTYYCSIPGHRAAGMEGEITLS